MLLEAYVVENTVGERPMSFLGTISINYHMSLQAIAR